MDCRSLFSFDPMMDDGSDCWPRICHNFHQILLEKTRWHIHTFTLQGAGEIWKTHIGWWIARSHDTPWYIPQLGPKPSKWIFPDKWSSSSSSARLFQMLQMHEEEEGALTCLPNWSGKGILAFRGRWWIPHEVGSRLRRSTARVTASPANSDKKCKWSFFRCQYVWSAFEPTVDSQQC